MNDSDEDIWKFFRVLGDRNRFRILDLLLSGERCVCELSTELGLAQNLVSHHLRTLRESGLVHTRLDPADGRWTYYRVNRDELLRRLGLAGEWADHPASWEGQVTCDREGRVHRPDPLPLSSIAEKEGGTGAGT